MLVTIFTPTYDRAALFPRLFESLRQLKYSEFEWVIVDDGSTDNTSELVNSYKKIAKFSITYVIQKNSGKHIAINKGLELAQGELFFILDSDDRLAPNALNLVVETYLNERKDNIGGVAFRGCYENGTVVGNSTFDKIESNSLDIRNIHGVTGDLVEVFTTRVMREFPFPNIPGEKFCPEALIWNRIATKYNLIYVNEAIYIVEYQAGGLSDRIVKIRMTSPIATMMTYGELASYDISVFQKVKAIINFWRFSFNSSRSYSYKLSLLNIKIGVILKPIGYLLYLRDIRKQKN